MTRLVPVGHVYGTPEVALALSLLDAAGIPAIVHGRRFGEMAWTHATALQGMALLVPESETQAAARALADFRPVRRRPGALLVAFYLLAAFWAVVPPPAGGYFALARAERTAAQRP